MRLGWTAGGPIFCFTIAGVALSMGRVDLPSVGTPHTPRASRRDCPSRWRSAVRRGGPFCPCSARRRGSRSWPEHCSRSGCSSKAALLPFPQVGAASTVPPVTTLRVGLFGWPQRPASRPGQGTRRCAARVGSCASTSAADGSRPCRPRPGRDWRASQENSHIGSWVRPAQSQARGQTRWRAPGVSRTLRRVIGVEPFEEWPTQPGIDEVLDVARGLQVVGRVVVGLPPLRTFAGILNAGGRLE